MADRLEVRFHKLAHAIDAVLLIEGGLRKQLPAAYPPFWRDGDNEATVISAALGHFGGQPTPEYYLWAACREIERLRMVWTQEDRISSA